MQDDVIFNFRNRNYVVVGASSGMGRQIALDLAKSGANVLAVARNVARLNEVQQMYPNNVSVDVLDVLSAKDEDWQGILAQFEKAHGKINGGVYSAGISKLNSLRMFDEKDAKEIMETNLWGMIFFLKNIIKKKYSCEGSSFVVFSSVAAHLGQKGGIAYAASKAAVGNVMKSVAKEIAPRKQRINSVSPGWVKTHMMRQAEQECGGVLSADIGISSYPLGLGVPEDVSGVVLFLLSDAARWITGTDIVVDGGYLLGID